MTSSNKPNPTADDGEDQTRISLQLNPPPPTYYFPTTIITQLTCAGRAEGGVNVSTPQLSLCMRGKHRDIQEKVYEFFNSRPDLQTPIEMSKDQHRELCMRQLLGLVREAGIRPFKYVVDDPFKYFVWD